MTASHININIILVIMIIIIILPNIVIINLFNIFIIDIISVYLATFWTEILTYNYTATCEVRDVVQYPPSAILMKIVKRLVIRTMQQWSSCISYYPTQGHARMGYALWKLVDRKEDLRMTHERSQLRIFLHQQWCNSRLCRVIFNVESWWPKKRNLEWHMRGVLWDYSCISNDAIQGHALLSSSSYMSSIKLVRLPSFASSHTPPCFTQ